MRRHSQLRASDSDRDAIVERLRKAAGEGRISSEELEERVDAALRARTYGELEWLIADLPRTDVARRRRPSLGRSAYVGAGALAAVTVPLLVMGVVIVFVLAAAALTAAWWIVAIAFWMICRGAGRRRHGWRRPRTVTFL
jgi:VIT1/CCC1 family predicted Fe2+/Mn2+ transporter